MPYTGPLARLWHIQPRDLDAWTPAELLELAVDVLATVDVMTVTRGGA